MVICHHAFHQLYVVKYHCVSFGTMSVTGCMALMAMGKEDVERQNAIVEFGAIPPLVRLLRLSKTTLLVMITVIKALATLSLGEY